MIRVEGDGFVNILVRVACLQAGLRFLQDCDFAFLGRWATSVDYHDLHGAVYPDLPKSLS